MTAPDAVTLAALRQALFAYLQTYGEAESMAEVRAIAGSILSARTKADALIVQGLELETWVDHMVAELDAGRLAETGWDAAAGAIAAQAKHWHDTLAVKAQAALDAYIQTYQPDLTRFKIQDIVATILPIVEDTQIARDEAHQLIRTLSQHFDWQTALRHRLDAKWISIAGKVHQSFLNQDITATVRDIVQAYIGKFRPTLVEIGTGLVEDALSALLNSQHALDLDLDLRLAEDTQRLVIEQVSFQLKSLPPGPVPSKTAQAIADDLNNAVTRFRKAQGLDAVSTMPVLVKTDQTTGSSALGGEMSIGIQLQPTKSASPSASDPGSDPA